MVSRDSRTSTCFTAVSHETTKKRARHSVAKVTLGFVFFTGLVRKV